MSYTTAEARQQLLDAIAVAIDELAEALGLLGVAYEQLDDAHADDLEEQLFRGVQRAYGRAKRTHAQFAERHALTGRALQTPSSRAPSTGVKALIDGAVEAVARAESELVALQDSLMPIEVGDAELRAGLREVRELIDGIPQRARAFVRTFGR
jgi:phage shock protein A